jgi:hypothetical protein
MAGYTNGRNPLGHSKITNTQHSTGNAAYSITAYASWTDARLVGQRLALYWRRMRRRGKPRRCRRSAIGDVAGRERMPAVTTYHYVQ